MKAWATLGAAIPFLLSAFLSGCSDAKRGGPPGAQSAVQAIMRSADAGDLATASFAGGSARTVAMPEGYLLIADVTDEQACVGVLKAATPDAVRFVVDGGTHLPGDLGHSSKRKRRAIRRLCSGATYPTRIEVAHRGGPKTE